MGLCFGVRADVPVKRWLARRWVSSVRAWMQSAMEAGVFGVGVEVWGSAKIASDAMEERSGHQTLLWLPVV